MNAEQIVGKKVLMDYEGLVAGGSSVGSGGFILNAANPVTVLILGWDATCLTFIALALHSMARRPPDEIRRRAASDDESRGFILGLVLIAAVASVANVNKAARNGHDCSANPLTR